MLLEKSEPSPDPTTSCPWRHYLRVPCSNNNNDGNNDNDGTTRLVPWRVVCIITRRHGIVHVPLGVDPERMVHEIDLEMALDLVETGELNDSIVVQNNGNTAPSIETQPAAPYSNNSFGGGIIRNITQMYSTLSHTERTTCLINILGCSRSANILAEAVPSNPRGNGEPAMSFVSKALNAGMHVVSANKTSLAHCTATDGEAYWKLQRLAKDNNVLYRHESAVMDGVPIFSLWRYALRHARLESIRGCLNSTTTMILTRMEGNLDDCTTSNNNGESYQEALDAAKQMGIVETDESLDVDGYDAAVKLRALLVVFTSSAESSSCNTDNKIRVPTMDEIPRDSIRNVTHEDIRRAYADGRKKYRLVASAEMISVPSANEGQNSTKTWEAKVQLQLLPPSDPLYNLSGSDASVTLSTDVLGPVTVVSSNPTLVDTAYGLFADIVSVASEGI